MQAGWIWYTWKHNPYQKKKKKKKKKISNMTSWKQTKRSYKLNWWPNENAHKIHFDMSLEAAHGLLHNVITNWGQWDSQNTLLKTSNSAVALSPTAMSIIPHEPHNPTTENNLS